MHRKFFGDFVLGLCFFLQITKLNSLVKVSDPGGYKWRLVIAYDGTKFAGTEQNSVY